MTGEALTQDDKSGQLSKLYAEIASLRMGAALLFRKAIRTHRRLVVDARDEQKRKKAVEIMEGYIASAEELLSIATERAAEADAIDV